MIGTGSPFVSLVSAAQSAAAVVGGVATLVPSDPAAADASCSADSYIHAADSRGGFVPDVLRVPLENSRRRHRLLEESIRAIHDPNHDELLSASPDPARLSPPPPVGTAGPLGVYDSFHNVEIPLLFPDRTSSERYARGMHGLIEQVIPWIAEPHVSLAGVLRLLARGRWWLAASEGDAYVHDYGKARSRRASTPIVGAYLLLARPDLRRLVDEVERDGIDSMALFSGGGKLEVEQSPVKGLRRFNFKPAISVPEISTAEDGAPFMDFVEIPLTEIKVYVDGAGEILEEGVIVDSCGQWRPDDPLWRHHVMPELSMANRVHGLALRDLYLEGLYRRAKHPSSDADDTIRAVAELHWWLAHGMPFNRGSAGIAEALTKAIFRVKGIFPGRWREDVSPDIKAFHLSIAQFIAQYPSFFV